MLFMVLVVVDDCDESDTERMNTTEGTVTTTAANIPKVAMASTLWPNLLPILLLRDCSDTKRC